MAQIGVAAKAIATGGLSMNGVARVRGTARSGVVPEKATPVGEGELAPIVGTPEGRAGTTRVTTGNESAVWRMIGLEWIGRRTTGKGSV